MFLTDVLVGFVAGLLYVALAVAGWAWFWGRR